MKIIIGAVCGGGGGGGCILVFSSKTSTSFSASTTAGNGSTRHHQRVTATSGNGGKGASGFFTLIGGDAILNKWEMGMEFLYWKKLIMNIIYMVIGFKSVIENIK